MMRSRLPVCCLVLLLLLADGCGSGRPQLVAPPVGDTATTASPSAVASATAGLSVRPATPSVSATQPVLVSPATSSPFATSLPVTLTAFPVPLPTVVTPIPSPTAASLARAPSPTQPPTAMARPPTPVPTPTARPVITSTPQPTLAVGPARTITRGPAATRLIALTFDAGADRGYAERILDTLRDAGVHASFGMTGRWAEQNPDLVRRMVAEGHLLINHTYNHASFTGYSPATPPLTADERRREIQRTEAIVAGITGVDLKPYFRPPYGDYDDATLPLLGVLGYRYNVMWTVDSLGWNGYSADRIVARCLAGAVPGAIMLFHVGADSQDAIALPEVVQRLRAAGYTFGTVADLLG